MRCILQAFVLLRACASATTSSSDSIGHTSIEASFADSGANTISASTDGGVPSSTISTGSSSSAQSKSTPAATVRSPLVFLPQISESSCPSRTVNYITHSLPQQCLRTSRTVSGNATTSSTGDEDVVLPTKGNAGQEPAEDFVDHWQREGATTTSAEGAESRTATSETVPDPATLSLEDEFDSPLDKSKFLSFEEWKSQNLEKAGQSPENVGQGRPQGAEGRRRPINNALDTLGEEGEIELDFTGFGDSNSRYTPGAKSQGTKATEDTTATESAQASPAKRRSKDAGKTCKERFNYASFDCAATVLKTNNKCKSSSSVLVENKDSYMLNECSINNKFIIVELCDDILVDTIVVANFEFFSSMFRTFRVSVSDRYPVKAEKWKDLGTFEARNSRDIQAFLVENPLIWARYLRIEFLTHYGNEFYCPVSLVRVHGTTMMEEFRHQEDAARGDDDEPELVPDVEPVPPVAVETPSSGTEAPPAALKPTEESAEIQSSATEEKGSAATSSLCSDNATMTLEDAPSLTATTTGTSPSSSSAAAAAIKHETSSAIASMDSSIAVESDSNATRASTMDNAKIAITSSSSTSSSQRTSTITSSKLEPQPLSNKFPNASTVPTSSTSSSRNSTLSGQKQLTTATTALNSASKVKSSVLVSSTAKPSKVAGTESGKAQAPPPQPTTQDSFFKQTNKRLNMLETNSSLNIQYIEEQSRILRDAFVQTEKLQLKKTENFLKHLNDTVMAELKGFRAQYDQLWQSTVIELEESKSRTQKEMNAFSSRLTLLADELVWAKRMNVVQSILLLAILGLFVFASKGKEYMDLPIMQQAFKRSQSVLRLGTHGSFDSPSSPASPESMHASSPEFTRNLRKSGRHERPGLAAKLPGSGGSYNVVVHQEDMLDPATPTDILVSKPGLQFEPPTPEASIDGHSIRERSPSPTLSSEETAKAIVRGAQSGPATPSGTRDNQPLSWEGTSNGDIQSNVHVQEPSSSLVPGAQNEDSSLARDGNLSPLRYSFINQMTELHADNDIVLSSIEEADDTELHTKDSNGDVNHQTNGGAKDEHTDLAKSDDATRARIASSTHMVKELENE